MWLVSTQHKTKSQRQLQRSALMGKLYEIFAGSRNAKNANTKYRKTKLQTKRKLSESAETYISGHSWEW